MHNSPPTRFSSIDNPISDRAWLSIGVMVMLMILSQIDRNSISIMVDPIKSGLGINDWKIGLLQGPAFALFFLLGSLAVGWMVDKYSERWLIFVGVIVWSVATIFSGLAGSFTALISARAFVGFGESVLQPAGWRIMARLFSARRLAMAIGILTASAQAGVAASFILVSALISNADKITSTIPWTNHLASWQFVFIVTGVPGIVLAFFVFLIPHRTAGPVTQQEDGGFVDVIRRNKYYLLHHFMGYGLLSILVHGVAAWSPTYLMRIHEIDVKDIGLLVGLVVIPLGVSGAIIAGWLVDRSFRNGKTDAHFSHFAYRCLAIAVLGGLAFMLKAPLLFTLICFGLIQFIQPFSGVAGASLQLATPEKYRGRMSGVFIMFYNSVGLMFGPSFVALLSNILGPDQIGIAIGMCYVVFGCAASFLLWRGRKYAMTSATVRHA